jgi:hypothetical protein
VKKKDDKGDQGDQGDKASKGDTGDTGPAMSVFFIMDLNGYLFMVYSVGMVGFGTVFIHPQLTSPNATMKKLIETMTA